MHVCIWSLAWPLPAFQGQCCPCQARKHAALRLTTDCNKTEQQRPCSLAAKYTLASAQASLRGISLCRKKDADDDYDPEQARKDMERLQLAKNKRCGLRRHWQRDLFTRYALHSIACRQGRACKRLPLLSREQERLKRIQDEGWDRYAPPSATNVK